MLIQLTQDELKDAVRLYVTSELNINLDGKVLTTTFTATRGDAGVITNLSIEKAGAVQANAAPAAVLEVTHEDRQQAKAPVAPAAAPVAPVIAADTATTAAAVAKTEAPEAATQEDVVTQAQSAEVAEAKVEAAAPAEAAPKTTSSLFG